MAIIFLKENRNFLKQPKPFEVFFFFLILFYFKLYITVLVLPNILCFFYLSLEQEPQKDPKGPTKLCIQFWISRLSVAERRELCSLHWTIWWPSCALLITQIYNLFCFNCPCNKVYTWAQKNIRNSIQQILWMEYHGQSTWLSLTQHCLYTHIALHAQNFTDTVECDLFKELIF